jgi:hypothetical protein
MFFFDFAARSKAGSWHLDVKGFTESCNKKNMVAGIIKNTSGLRYNCTRI